MISRIMDQLSEFPALSTLDPELLGEIFAGATAGVDCEVDGRLLGQGDIEILQECGFIVDPNVYDDEADSYCHISW